jgi:class 3 adenylate cyclase
MSLIALAHGGTIDRFSGDAILVFFGDPETKGDSEDAKACVRMAIAMQQRLRELGNAWYERGLQRPFEVRMGINTGYCNVGNFGSAEWMDYTIIGAEVNLAARLQHIVEPGGIVMSSEAYALAKDIVVAHAVAPITMKGISREVIPYVVDRQTEMSGEQGTVVSEHVAGLDLRPGSGPIKSLCRRDAV